MGLLEFLQWCEDLRMEPVLAVYAGYSLGGQVVKPGPDLDPYVQEALEEIEYVTGGAETKWGAVRGRDGHPAPFKLRYVEVGNEDQFDRAKTYDGRFAQFFKAIKAKYPGIQVIATIPVKGVTPDVVDDHYYKRQQGMFERRASTIRPIGKDRRFSSASGPPGKERRRRISARPWAMPLS